MHTGDHELSNLNDKMGFLSHMNVFSSAAAGKYLVEVWEMTEVMANKCRYSGMVKVKQLKGLVKLRKDCHQL